MKRSVLVVSGAVVRARGESMPIYYDYVENGKLTSGKIMIDPANPMSA